MEPVSSRHPRGLFGLKLIFALSVVMVLQAAIFVSILDKTIGTSSWTKLFHRAAGHPSAGFAYTPRVALLKSAASARLSEPTTEGYYNLSRQWAIALQEAGIPFRIISDAELNSSLSSQFDVVVLPSAVCLSGPQREAVGTLLHDGVGLVASGALGARDGNCDWRGWEFLSSTFGITKPTTVRIPTSTYAAFRSGQFYSELVPAGYRLTVPPQEIVTGNCEAPDIYWSDGRLRPARGASVGEAGLGLHGRKGAGRFVWFGFKETLPDSSGRATRALVNEFLATTVRWTGRQPLAAFGNWPHRARAAAIVAEDAANPGDARPAAEVLSRRQVPATFFLNSPGEPGGQRSLSGLSAAGEIASAGDSAQAFAEQDAAVQVRRLNRAKESLERSGAQPIVGFHPPQDVWDTATVQALKDAGYSYYLDHSMFERAAPETMTSSRQRLFETPHPELTRISATASNDLEVISRYTGPTPWGADLADGFLPDLGYAEYLGGVYTLLFRSDLLGAPENVHILDALTRRIKAAPVWVASAENLVRWWSKREKVRVETRMITPTRIRVAVTNGATDSIQDASAYVYLPFHPRSVRLIPELLTNMKPSVALSGGDDVLRMDFPVVNGNSSYVCLVVLDES